MAGLHRAGALLLAHGKAEIWAHSQAVAAEAARLAGRFGLDADACALAGYAHDLGGIYDPAWMLERARTLGWAIDPAEAAYPFLLHQRFSRVLCEEELGVTDEAVLSAVACHSTLGAAPAPFDMAVFLADKLAWDQPGAPPFEAVVRQALRRSLAEGCKAYIDYVMENGMILMPHRQLLDARAWLATQA